MSAIHEVSKPYWPSAHQRRLAPRSARARPPLPAAAAAPATPRCSAGPRALQPQRPDRPIAVAAPQDPQFESASSGASHTYPMQAGNIRKNGHICIKGRPCKAS
jgi:hypothetical protein